MNKSKRAAEVERVAKAIKRAWEECGETPFPLYDREARELAKAAIAATTPTRERA